MRIAISGTHSQGKSTFVNDWTNRHHRYILEEEPFRALHDEGYDIRFRQESTRLHNGIQMYYNISRLMSYQQDSDCVIFDRCPVDYIAYSQYTANHRTTDIKDKFVESLAARVRDSLQNLDLLIFLPITSEGQLLWKMMGFVRSISPIAMKLIPSSNKFIGSNDSL